MAPTVTPIRVAIAATVRAISMSFCTPAITWANMSLPMELVPKGLPQDGGTFRLLVIAVELYCQKWPDEHGGDAEEDERCTTR